jgi:hypothetical protein
VGSDECNLNHQDREDRKEKSLRGLCGLLGSAVSAQLNKYDEILRCDTHRIYANN